MAGYIDGVIFNGTSMDAQDAEARTEISSLKSAISDSNNNICGILKLDFDLLKNAHFEVGSFDGQTGANVSGVTNKYRTGYIDVEAVKTISFHIDTGYKYIPVLINASKTAVVWIPDNYSTSDEVVDVESISGAKYCRVLYQTTSDTLPSDLTHISATYTSELGDEISSSLKSGDVTYNALSPELQNTLKLKYNDDPESLTFSNTNSLLKKDGTLVTYSGSYAVTDYIDCSSWLGLMFSGRQYYDGQCLAFYNSDYTFISCFPNSISGANNYTNQIITVPENAKYIRLAQYETVVTYAYIATKYIPSQIGEKWYGKKWVCIGDSLTEVNSAAAKRYHDYIANATGITVVNLGVGGTGYMNGGSGGANPFRNRVSSIPLDADVITIFGSFNDLGETRPLGTESDTGTDTIGGCVNTTLDDIFTRLPLANIGIVTPTPWGAGMYPLDSTTSGYNYVQLLKDICERRGIPCLDLFHCSQLRPWDSTFKTLAYSNDNTGVHPDENGHKLIAPRFEGFLDSLLFS